MKLRRSKQILKTRRGCIGTSSQSRCQEVKGKRDKRSRAIGQTTQVGHFWRMLANKDLGRGLKEILKAWIRIREPWVQILSLFLLVFLCSLSPATHWSYSTASSKGYWAGSMRELTQSTELLFRPGLRLNSREGLDPLKELQSEWTITTVVWCHWSVQKSVHIHFSFSSPFSLLLCGSC